MSTDVVRPRVQWSRVAWFYGIALGGAVLAAVVLWLVKGVAGPSGVVLAQAGAAVLYMPLPLVAGLVVEWRAGRRPLIADEWRRLRTRFWRTAGRSAAYGILTMIAVLALGFAVAWIASALGVPGAGRFVATDADFRERLLQINPALPADVALPPVTIMVTGLLVQGLLAGLTINALFAFGEEYGWRGVLAQELAPLGVVRSNLVTGVLWGLWHAPIIIGLGHNYGAEWGWGVPMMVLWTTPFAFLLSWVRQRAGSVLAPAILHGAYNGTIGAFAMVLIGGNLFVALPMGLLMTLVLTVVAVVVWRLPARPAGGPDDSPGVPAPAMTAQA